MNGTVHYREGQFPPCDLDWGRLVPLIGPANAAVARYDGMLAAIPNAHVLLSPEGILRELTPASGRRSATIAYPELLNITEGHDLF
jgi:hypothetical protein